MFQDLRHAIRLLLQNKGWTLVVVLSVALGIGANTALFGAVNGLLLQTIAVDHPDTLVRLKYVGKNDMGDDFSDYGFSGMDASGRDIRATFTYPIYKQFKTVGLSTMSGVLAGAPASQINVVVDGQAEVARGFLASGNFYQVLGVTASIGRTFRPEDDELSAAPVAVISDGFWKRRFGGRASVLGTVVQVNNTPVTIVGITPPQFAGIQQAIGVGPDVTVPLALASRIDESKPIEKPTTWWLQVVGRLKPRVTPAQVQGSLDGVFQATAHADWDALLSSLNEQERSSSRYRDRNAVPHLRVDSARHGIYDANTKDVQSLTLLSVVVAVLLLIVCANVANLLLSRASARRREISVRLSLGASRARLIRQLLTESLLLAAVGGLAGLVIGYWSRQLLPIGTQAPFDWRLFAFVTALTFVTGIVFGIAPAVKATQFDVSAALKESSRSATGARSRLSKVLLVAQVAMSIVLLVGAGLFLNTLRNLRNVDVGFDTSNLMIFRVSPALNRYDKTRSAALYRTVQERLASLPGVRGVSLSQPPLLSGGTSSTDIYIEGHDYTNAASDRLESTRPRGSLMYQVTVSSSFFSTMGIPLLAGRTLTDRDDQQSPRVVVINETAARKYFAGDNPVGKRFGNLLETRTQTEIVGVVRDAKYNSLRDAAPPTMYLPIGQRNWPGMAVEVRTASDPASFIAAVRDAVRRIDPNLPVMNITTQAEQVEGRLAQERLFAQAYALFGLLALALASIGLFGLMSYSVSRRTNEIGIRMALGADRRDVVGLVMKESMIMVAAGIGIGLAGALVAGRLVTTWLFGLEPTDPLTIVVAVAVMTAVSAIAGYLPARRASHVDPMVALRYE